MGRGKVCLNGCSSALWRRENPKFCNVRALREREEMRNARHEPKKYFLWRNAGEPFLRVPCELLGDYICQLKKAKNDCPREDDGGFAHPMDEYRTPNATPALEYLIIDCRPLEDYEACHIEGALHYPKSRLAHATNPLLPEMFAIQNESDKLIVLYDMEGKFTVGQNMAVILSEKGINNLAVLDGGLREFVRKYSSLIIGECPVPIVPRDSGMQKRAAAAIAARSETNRSFFSHKPRSLSNSLAKFQKRQ